MAYTTINKSTDYFNTKLYTGTGSELALTGVNFQPDLTWIKNRDTTDSHQLVDSVRGATKNIFSNLTNAEATDTQGLKSFDTDGFTVGTRAGMNTSGEDYVGWNWKANGSGSANTDGDINSTVSVNTTAGFSIVKYTGSGSVATIGHGLGVAPKLIIVKRLTGGTEAFPVDCRAVSGIMYLNETGALGSYGNSSPFPSDAPTSTKFYVGSANNANASGSDFIAYCFAEKTGYSKIGSYTGNGNADGTFVYTGFKPAFILRKETSNADAWIINDTKRNPINNASIVPLYPNASNAEPSGINFDFLSNGFKIRNTDGDTNTSGATYIYMAFGQSLVGSNNVPCTAR